MYCECKERDWKLFRKKLPGWQENAIENMNQNYIRILQSDLLPSEKFDQLEKQMSKDRKKASYSVDLKRSMLLDNLFLVLREKAITLNDLNGFSEYLSKFC